MGWPLDRRIVESERIQDQVHLSTIITACRHMGFRVALDDFGIGHANLGMLISQRPDQPKIDRQLVMGCDRNSRRQTLLTGRAGLVAERVETPAEARRLCREGIFLQEGYCFRPIVPECPG